MLYESANLGVSTGDGIATLRMDGPTLPELAAAVAVTADTPGLSALVVRGRLAPPWFADARSFAAAGQRLCRAVAALPFPVVAFLEGPCLGPSLELALACDVRLAVAGPDSWVGFPTPPCWGGSARCTLPGLVTAREAVRLGIFDDACSARRGGIEVQLRVDRLLRRPWKRPAPRRLDEHEAAERQSAVLPPPADCTWHPLPGSVGLVGPGLGGVAGELAVRGVAVCGDHAGAETVIQEGLRRGRWTPLEADQARRRLTTADPPAAEWTVSTVGPVPARPGRLVTLPSPDVPGWLRRVGVTATPRPAAVAYAHAA
jgi:hypothetical protein